MSKQSYIFENILDIIGNTPIVSLKAFSDVGYEIYAKCEFMNPGGSIKDRIGLPMILDAEKRGLLKPNTTIVEATAGNTGVALAMAALQRGYKMVAVVTDKASEEKIRLLKLYKANIIKIAYSNSNTNPGAFVEYAKHYSESIPNSWFANQFYNEMNAAVHFNITGPEIWQQMDGKIDAVVAGIGTGGTLCGLGRYMKKMNPEIKLILADPVGSIQAKLFYGEKNPSAHKYLVEGIGGDFIPGLADLGLIDMAFQVSDKDACIMCHSLLEKEAIFAGSSSGAILYTALQYGRKLKKSNKRHRIVVILPDDGRNYFDTFYNRNWCKTNLDYILPSEELEKNAIPIF